MDRVDTVLMAASTQAHNQTIACTTSGLGHVSNMNSVYIETTVVGHIAGRLHPNASVLARQQVTREWWLTACQRYRVLASDLVIAECSAGDVIAARERLLIVEDIELIETTGSAIDLADLLISARAIPASEPRDATHIALAAVNGIDFLTTWNFKHIMNPATQHLIDAVCRDAGFEPATICTPEQLLEVYDDS